MQTIVLPANCQETDKIWQHYFENLKEEAQKFSEVTFQAETVPPEPTFWQKVLKKIPQPETVTVTMKEFDPNRVMVQDTMISLYTTEEEAGEIRNLKLSDEVVHLGYIMTILPKRHRVSFHIGNLIELKIGS